MRAGERQREATRKRGKKQRGNEIKDEAWDTEKETEKAKNSASILQHLQFNPAKIPIITTFESLIYT